MPRPPPIMEEAPHGTHATHATLVEQASSGDAAAREALLTRHFPGLLAYLRLHTGAFLRAKESISDLAQSVCLEVLLELDGFEYRGEAPFRHWLFRKAASKIVDRQRYYLAERRHPDREHDVGGAADGFPASAESPSGVAMQHEDLDRLAAVFDQLPPDYQQVITLAKVVGYSHEEIAAEMGRSPGAVRVLLHRALARVGWLVHQG